MTGARQSALTTCKSVYCTPARQNCSFDLHCERQKCSSHHFCVLCRTGEPTVGIIGLTPKDRGLFSFFPDGTEEEDKELAKSVFDALFASVKGITWKGEALTSQTLDEEAMLIKVASCGGF